jgi:CRP/FNR family transcriptional regulator, cyclic AMP receptor protein
MKPGEFSVVLGEVGPGMIDSHRYCVAFSMFVRRYWNDLRAFTRTDSFQRKQVIYSIGDPSDAIYLIESGQVKVVQLSEDGKEKIVGLYQRRDLFGEVCVCEKAKREDQAIALEPATVSSFSVKVVLELVAQKPELALKLLMVFCARLVECHEEINALSFDEVRERLVKELLRLSRSPAGRRESGGVRLAVSLTHQELAQLVTTTRETATSIMNEFRRYDLVDYGRGGILVFPDKLENYLRKSSL